MKKKALSRVPVYTVEILGRKILVRNMMEAADVVNAIVDRTGMGASELGAEFPIEEDGVQVGYVSYNGRVWKGPLGGGEAVYENSPDLEGAFTRVLVRACCALPWLSSVKLRYCAEADKDHRRRWRQFAHTGCRPDTVCFARAARTELTYPEMVGMSAHELGHIVGDVMGFPAHRKHAAKAGKTPQAVQDEADMIAAEYFRLPIRYNARTIQEAEF